MKSTLAFVSMVLAGCATAHMDVPAPLAQADQLKVEGPGAFGDTLKFGPYVAKGIHRGWTEEEKIQVDHYFHTDKGQSFAFRLFNNDSPRQTVTCRAGFDADGAQFGSLALKGSHVGLGCRVGHTTDVDAGWIALEQDGHRLVGHATVGDVTLSIESESHLVGAAYDSGQPVGYKLYVDGQLVGAVQTINGGNVWLAKDVTLEVRQAASLTAATLLLFPDLRS